MRVAVATNDGQSISSHFGRSTYFAIYEISGGAIVHKEMRQNTFTRHLSDAHRHEHHHEHHSHQPGHGHGDGHHGVVRGLSDCQVVISHGMGRRAVDDLTSAGMDIYVTGETDVEKAVQAWIGSSLTTDERRIHG